MSGPSNATSGPVLWALLGVLGGWCFLRIRAKRGDGKEEPVSLGKEIHNRKGCQT